MYLGTIFFSDLNWADQVHLSETSVNFERSTWRYVPELYFPISSFDILDSKNADRL
jgi:hypothetical protein